MNNIHGDRVNTDLLRRDGSGYAAAHGPDFLASADPWFQGLQLRYGPGGAVYLSDWYDTGECHTRQPHEATGRIYKIAYRGGDKAEAPSPLSTDVSKLSGTELAGLQLHRNDWFVRHARRVLHERHRGVGTDPATHEALRTILTDNPDAPRKLRALWALHVTGGLSEADLLALLDHDHEYVRAWAVQLLGEDRDPSAEALKGFAELAARDESPVVRLYLASAAQRIASERRVAIVEALIAHEADADDPNLPFMYWYAMEPLVRKDRPDIAVRLIARTKIPVLREWVARKLAEP
jgi:hypothetical protein